MGKIFFTGDLHFGHANVIAFDNRPFKTVEEMDAELIRRWNNKVGKGDLTYVLGDMIWKARNDDAPELIKSLNGQIILIKGNHDRFLHNAKAKAALAGIKDYDDICVSLEDGTKKRVILSHYFTPMYNGHRYQAIHLHAHSHFTDEADFEVDFAKRLNSIGCRNEMGFIADCRKKKIFVCVYESGDGSLLENTKELLANNLNNPTPRTQTSKSRDAR